MRNNVKKSLKKRIISKLFFLIQIELFFVNYRSVSLFASSCNSKASFCSFAKASYSILSEYLIFDNQHVRTIKKEYRWNKFCKIIMIRTLIKMIRSLDHCISNLIHLNVLGVCFQMVFKSDDNRSAPIR
jgi:hypothetical protein